MRTTTALLLALLACGTATADDGGLAVEGHAARLTGADLAARLSAAVERVTDYAVVLEKQQHIDGKTRPKDTLRLKHRRAPACRYLGWVAGPHEGREALHCEGRNDGDMTVHEGGFLGIITIDLDPDGKRARRDDLRSITETGIWNIAQMVEADRALQLGDDPPAVTVTARDLDGRSLSCLAADRGAPLTQRYDAGQREVCIDDATALPAEVRIWRTDGTLMEHYRFRDYVLNPGLTDADFDPDNDAYDF